MPAPGAPYGQRAEAVTPSDTTDLAMGCSASLFVGVGGDLVVITEGGSTLTLTNVQAGNWYTGLRVTRVLATGTSASGIIAFTP